MQMLVESTLKNINNLYRYWQKKVNRLFNFHEIVHGDTNAKRRTFDEGYKVGSTR